MGHSGALPTPAPHRRTTRRRLGAAPRPVEEPNAAGPIAAQALVAAVDVMCHRRETAHGWQLHRAISCVPPPSTHTLMAAPPASVRAAPPLLTAAAALCFSSSWCSRCARDARGACAPLLTSGAQASSVAFVRSERTTSMYNYLIVVYYLTECGRHAAAAGLAGSVRSRFAGLRFSGSCCLSPRGGTSRGAPLRTAGSSSCFHRCTLPRPRRERTDPPPRGATATHTATAGTPTSSRMSRCSLSSRQPATPHAPSSACASSSLS